MIAEDEWLVVIDRQKVFAESEWSAWACADGTYYDTNEAFEKLAKAFGDRVVYTRYVAPIPPRTPGSTTSRTGRSSWCRRTTRCTT